jgi:hypothetical protein
MEILFIRIHLTYCFKVMTPIIRVFVEVRQVSPLELPETMECSASRDFKVFHGICRQVKRIRK